MKKAMDDLLQCAAGQQASDLHVSEHTPPMIRVAGQLRPLPPDKDREQYNLAAAAVGNAAAGAERKRAV